VISSLKDTETVSHQIVEAMRLLGLSRPCFHSEADFQFALAWQFKVLMPGAEIRLEIPQVIGPATYKLDVLVRALDAKVALELKYLKAPLSGEIGGEGFNLVDAVAHDINRYDVLKDVQRLEQILGANRADHGFAIVLTNQPKYWEPRKAGNRVDEAFGIEQDRKLGGEMAWAPHTGGTSKGREKTISLAGTYVLNWLDYSDLSMHRFGQFRWLCVSVARGLVPTESARLARFEAVVPAHSRTRPDYEAFRAYLDRQDAESLELSFSEIEAVTGELPKSARTYREWWANHAGNPQATWLSSGWKVGHVDISHELVGFLKRGL